MRFKAIVMGVSAGGLSTLSKIFIHLKKGFAVPIAVVQHLHPTQNMSYITILNNQSALPVLEIRDKQAYFPANIYIAPPDYHAHFESNGEFSLSIDEKVNHCRPSVDVLFESAARVFGKELLGIVLTGANADGAKGLQLIKEVGGGTIVEDPATAEHPFMPNAALKLIQPDYVLEAEKIAKKLNELC